jgi:O-antigen/teichoic acid export membrane protein
MCSFAATTLFYALLSLRLHRAILVIACSVLVVNVILAATLGAAHGAMGAAYATLASEVVGLAIGFAVLRRSHPGVVPALGVIPRVAVAGAAAALVALIPGLPPVADALIGSAVYIVVVWAVGAVPRELLEAIRHPGVAAPGP